MALKILFFNSSVSCALVVLCDLSSNSMAAFMYKFVSHKRKSIWRDLMYPLYFCLLSFVVTSIKSSNLTLGQMMI